MDFREMEYIVTIAECGSLTAAARLLYVGQPNLTKCVHAVEKELGITLFNREGRRLVPTYAGERILEHSRKILDQKREMELEIRNLARQNSGRLNIGMPPVRYSFTVPKIRPLFKKLYPEVQVSVTEDNSAELDKMLIDGKLDIAFFMLSKRVKGLQYKIIHEDKMYVIMKKGHPLEAIGLEKGALTLADLSGETLLIQKHSQRQGEFIRTALEHNKIEPASIMETQNIRASTDLATGGYGIAFLSGDLMKNLQIEKHCTAIPLTGTGQRFDFVAAWKDKTALPVYALDFVRLVSEVYTL